MSVSPIITHNTITASRWQGIYSCNGPIANNIISENNGGIAYCDGPITDNVISNNSNVDSGRGGALSFCKGPITGNVLTGNYAAYKGGACYECTGDIMNNTITGNKSAIRDLLLTLGGGAAGYGAVDYAQKKAHAMRKQAKPAGWSAPRDFVVADHMLTGSGIGLAAGLAAGIALRRALKDSPQRPSALTAYGVLPMAGAQTGLVAGRTLGKHKLEQQTRDEAQGVLDQVQKIRNHYGF